MQASEIVVATLSRPHFLLVERATRNQDISVRRVDPTLEGVSSCLAEASDVVVVVDAVQEVRKALVFCRTVKAKHPRTRILILGSRADVGIVASAVSAGATNVFLTHTPVDELSAVLADAVGNKPVNTKSLFGRVWSVIPGPPDKDGICRNRCGQQYPLQKAIAHCQALGLEPGVIAEQLKLPADKLEAILKNVGKTPSQSMLSRLGSLVPAAEDLQMSTGEASSLKPLFSVFVLLCGLFAGWKLLAGGLFGQPREPFSYCHIQGSMTYDDGGVLPVPDVILTFIPVDVATDGRRHPRTGQATLVSETGRFDFASTRRRGDGVVAGWHKILVTGPNRFPLAANVVPVEYASFDTTPLKVDARIGRLELKVRRPSARAPSSPAVVPSVGAGQAAVE